MEKFRYDTYCGLYCGACEILNAFKHGGEERVAKMWNKKPEEIRCYGCKTEDIFINCGGCEIRKCARNKGVEFCNECEEFPCKRYNLMREIVDKLPHMVVIFKNLEDIKKKGVQVWLKEQEQKWNCPDCGVGFAWYMEKCRNCGRELDDCKDYVLFEKDN